MANEYLTVGRGYAEFYEKKSRFIGNIAHSKSEDDARAFISEISSEHTGATHNVYCYILRENNTIRFSDDGEPSGTAGKPALDILIRAGVKDCCLVITRYFGGILLGAGGLVRAYAAAAKLALENAGILKMLPYLRAKAVFAYPDWVRAEPALKKTTEILNVNYGAAVEATFYVSPDSYAQLSGMLKDMTSGRAEIALLGEELRGARTDG